MTFCSNCGSQVDGPFCQKCGTPVGAPAPGGAAPPPPGPYYQQPSQPPPPPSAAGAGLTENVAGALCYLAGLITGIVFLVLEPYNRNKTIRFHAFQSIFFSVVLIAVEIVLAIFFRIMLQILPFSLWFLISLITWVVMLAFLVLWIMLMVKAYQNQKWVLPIIGPLADKQA